MVQVDRLLEDTALQDNNIFFEAWGFTSEEVCQNINHRLFGIFWQKGALVVEFAIDSTKDSGCLEI